MRSPCLVCIAVVLGVSLLLPAAASAEDRPFRLGTELGIFQYTHVTVDPDGPGNDESRNETDFGLLPGAGVNLGYRITDAIYLGATLSFSVRSGETVFSNDSITTLEFGLAPHFEYWFGSGSLRPFVGAQLGLLTSSVSDGVDFSTIEFGLGPRAGLHIFVTDAVSFDPQLTFNYYFGSATLDTPVGNIDYSVSGLSLAISAGISAWL